MTPASRPRPTRVALSLATLLLIALAAPLASQQRLTLKVYISSDMEGIAGLVSGAQVSAGQRDYEIGRRLMIAETNAAIAGAFEAGATEVLVNDSHGSQTNLLAEELDRRASLITGSPKPLGMMQGIDSTFHAVVFIGYHAQASTVNAVLGHTYSGALKRVTLNGREVGEYGLNAAIAGHHGVPVVFIAGDRAVADQARALIPGVEALAVKDGIGQTAARTLHPADARERITVGVRSALARRSQIRPLQLGRPVVIEVEVSNVEYADAAMLVPGMRRVSGRVVSYEAPNMAVAYTVSRLIMTLARP
ncbi:MAG: M55 family metallopeptidase [Gemmatimonadaceae bacterium]